MVLALGITGLAHTQDAPDFPDVPSVPSVPSVPDVPSSADELPAGNSFPVVEPVVQPVSEPLSPGSVREESVSQESAAESPSRVSPSRVSAPAGDRADDLRNNPERAWVEEPAIPYGAASAAGFEPYSTRRFARELDKRVTVTLEVGYFYDSNTSLSQNRDDSGGDGVFTADLSVVLNSDLSQADGRGGFFYRVGYNTSAFSYSTSESRQGRDPFEHQFNGALGYRGGKTTVTLGGNLGLRNGNALEYTQIDRETGRADGKDYGVNLTIDRQLDHSSIEAMAGYQMSDYSGDSAFGQYGDLESVLGDVAWYYEPGWAPKTQLGVGVSGGRDKVDTDVGEQQHWAPSVRMRHQLTAKSRLEGFVGSDFRDYDGAGTISTRESLTYGLSAHWQATHKTGFEAALTRGVHPSVTGLDESYESTGFSLGMNMSLPANWFLNAHAQFENADYFSNLVGGSAPRDDDYFSTGLSFSRSVKLTNSLAGTLSLFYDYRENSSSLSDLDYDQNIAGVKFGISF